MDSSVKLTPVAGGYALAGGASALAPASQAAPSGGLGALFTAGDTGLADALGGLGWAKTAGVFLVLGLLLAFTPCVLPMIPILSSIVTERRGLGRVAADAVDPDAVRHPAGRAGTGDV
ncbi:hypothetical protein G6F31_019973 [Rhizopus arrhizus]|nr:hypothetical protein G6F31_019973 [Rhizopus arrhizus]